MPVSPAFLRTLADVVGAAHCLVGADRGPFVVEGRTPCAAVFPGTADEAARAVSVAMRVLHIVEVLDTAYAAAEGPRSG